MDAFFRQGGSFPRSHINMFAQQVSNTEPGQRCAAVVEKAPLLGGTGRYQTKVTNSKIQDFLNSCIRIEHQREQCVIPLQKACGGRYAPGRS